MDRILTVIAIALLALVKLLITGVCLSIGFRMGTLINIKIDRAYNKSKTKERSQPSAVGQPTVV